MENLLKEKKKCKHSYKKEESINFEHKFSSKSEVSQIVGGSVWFCSYRKKYANHLLQDILLRCKYWTFVNFDMCVSNLVLLNVNYKSIGVPQTCKSRLVGTRKWYVSRRRRKIKQCDAQGVQEKMILDKLNVSFQLHSSRL